MSNGAPAHSCCDSRSIWEHLGKAGSAGDHVQTFAPDGATYVYDVLTPGGDTLRFPDRVQAEMSTSRNNGTITRVELPT